MTKWKYMWQYERAASGSWMKGQRLGLNSVHEQMLSCPVVTTSGKQTKYQVVKVSPGGSFFFLGSEPSPPRSPEPPKPSWPPGTFLWPSEALAAFESWGRLPKASRGSQASWGPRWPGSEGEWEGQVPWVWLRPQGCRWLLKASWGLREAPGGHGGSGSKGSEGWGEPRGNKAPESEWGSKAAKGSQGFLRPQGGPMEPGRLRGKGSKGWGVCCKRCFRVLTTCLRPQGAPRLTKIPKDPGCPGARGMIY